MDEPSEFDVPVGVTVSQGAVAKELKFVAIGSWQPCIPSGVTTIGSVMTSSFVVTGVVVTGVGVTGEITSFDVDEDVTGGVSVFLILLLVD